jgi:polar amino acid transport system substrate-binding protein
MAANISTGIKPEPYFSAVPHVTGSKINMVFKAFVQGLRGFSLVLGATLALTGAASAQTSYKVGSTPTGVPFTFLNVQTNQIDGIMVDIIKAIGAEEGFEAEVEATQWSALIPSLTSSKIDIIAAAMYATPARAEVVAFSDKVYSYGEGLIVPKDSDAAYTSIDEMEGLTVGVQVGTAYIPPLEASGKFKEIKIYDSLADIMRDVSLGRIDAGFGDRPILAYQMAQGAADVRLLDSYQSQILGDVAIAVRQDDTELLATINDGLAKIEASGALDEILTKWGLQ